MKKIILLLVFINSFNALCQTQSVDSLSSAEFNALIQKKFTKLLTGQASAALGSYASLNLGETEVTFSPKFILKNKDILTFKFNGGVTDGINSLFTNSKLNSNTAIEVQYHFLSKINNSLIFDLESYKKYKSEKTKIRKESEFKINKMRYEFCEEKYIKKIDSIIEVKSDRLTKIKSIEKTIEELKTQQLTFSSSNIEFKRIECEINTKNLILIKERMDYENDSLTQTKMESIIANSKSYFNKKTLEINNERNEAISKTLNDFDAKGFKLSWFTLSYKLKNDAFKLLDPAETYDNQIEKIDDISHEFKTQFSYINLYNDNATFFFTTSLSYKYKSNFDDLDKTDVSETTTVGTSTASVRETKKSFVAYTGNYEKGISEVNFSSDLYYYFSHSDIIGIHLFPKSTFTENLKPQHNFGVGFIVPFKNIEKENSLYNVELY